MGQLSLVVPRHPDERWQLAKQMGVTDAVVHPLEFGSEKTHWSDDDLLGTKNWLEDAGLNFTVLEGNVPLTDRIRLGRAGRDEDNSNPGHHIKGTLFAIGYVRGLQESAEGEA